MTPEEKAFLKEQLVKRLKSFAWRAGSMLAVTLVDFVAQNLGLFHLPPQWTVTLGLALGELTKFLNR